MTTSSGGSGKRPTMPGADELFRATAKPVVPQPPNETAPNETAPNETAMESVAASGRVKHDEKMTIYVTAAELLAVEQARLTLRAELGRPVDRGRFVRAALAVALEDLEARGTHSDVARRLSES